MEDHNRTKRKQRLDLARMKGTHTREEWLEMKLFFNTCVKCEGESHLANTEKDHILPLYLGGSDSIINLQPLCAYCNISKTGDSTDHRIKYCEKYSLDMPTQWLGEGVNNV